MENKLRRGLALLMTLIMLISCAPMDALAAIVPVSGGTQTSEGFALKSIVKPPVATVTYVFMNGTEEFARQIVKNGETLNNPGTPDSGSENKEFTGWLDNNNQAPVFGAVTVTETKTITYRAQFDDVYFVFFTNPSGEVMVTKKGANGDTISTEGVTYPVGNEQSIIGWNYTGNEDDPLISEVKLEGKDVTLKAVVKDGHWITYDSQGGTYVAPAFVKGDATTTAPAAPTRPGYTFHHWSETKGGAAFDFGQQLDQALTLYAVWTPNANTQYTVIHWWQNANDDGYTYHESETKTGKTGEMTAAEGKTYNVNGTNVLGNNVSDRVFTAQAITQETIAGDGSTIVNVYYTRKSYTITFRYRRTQYSSWQVLKKLEKKWGENLKESDWYTYNNDNNYTIQGSERMIAFLSTMPMNGATLNAIGSNGNVNKATYYVEALSSDESGAVQVGGRWFIIHHVDQTKGTANYTVGNEDRYPIAGFTLISDMGTQVGGSYGNAKFYYSRNSYKVIYYNGDRVYHEAPYKYEEDISNAGSYEPANPPAGIPNNYKFDGWYNDPDGSQKYDFSGKKMPVGGVVVYAKWVAPTSSATAFTTIIGGSSETIDPIPYGGTITDQLNDLQATIMQDKDGYTWRGWRTGPNGTGEPFNVDTKIYSNITLYPYYTKDGTFRVEYVAVKNDVTAPVDGKSYAEDSFADLKSPGKLVADDGEYFLGWSDGAATYQPRDKYQIKSNHADEQNVITLTAQWGARPAGTTLTYKANGGTGEDVVENLANNATVTTIANPFSRVGYTFKGWDTNPKGEGSIAPNTQVQVDNNGANVLYAIWTANTDTKYTVEFYYQNVDGTYTLNHSDKRTATTDTTVSVTDADKAAKENNKYVYDESAANVESGIVKGDGSLVLKLYFKLNTASYTIHHYLNDTTVKVAEDQTGTKTIGETLTANKSDALYAAYAAAGVASYAPSQTITIAADESENVITVYYTMPLTIKAKDASKTYDGQPLTQPDFTMKGLVNGDTKENFSLSMTAASTITNAGSTRNVIDTDTVKYNGGAIPSYYNVSYNPGTLTVNKASATVTITGVNETAEYDGRQHEANGYNYSFTGKPNEITISLKPNVLAIARRTDVGTTYMGLTKDSFTVTSANYDVTIKAVNDGYVTITPITEKQITITANSASKTYDGTPLTDGGSSFTEGVLVDGDVLTAVVEGSATNVGDEGRNVVKSYKVMRGDVDVTGNYTFGNSIDGKLTINKREVTLTSASDSKTYDGTPLTNGNVTIGGQGFADGEGATFNVTGTITNVGKMPNDFTYTLNEGTNANNYTITPTAGELEVTPVTDEVVVTITGHKDTVTYDGTEHTVKGYDVSISNELYKEADFTFTGSAEVKATDASDTAYAMGLKDTDFANKNGNFSNVTFIVTDGSLTINKRTVTLKSEGGSKEYDGTPLTKPDVTVGGDGFVAGEVTDVKATGSVTFVHEGEVANTITYTEGEKFNADNYTITKNEGTLTITKREGEGKTITVTAANGEKVYDGAPLTNNSFTHAGALVEGDVLTAVVEGSQTDVGVGDNVVTSYVVMRGETDVTTSYTFTESKKGALTVTLRGVTFTGESKSLPYTGGMQSITGITQSGLVEGHRYEGLTYKAEGQNVGSYDGAFSGDVVIKDAQGNDVTKNYNVTKTPGTLTITNASFTVTFTGESDTKVYNGKEQSITGITVVGLKTGHRYEGLTYAAKGTDKGEYEGTFTGTVKILDENNVDVTENYAVTKTPGKLTITAVETEVVVTITGHKDTVTYDGTEHTVKGYDVSISNELYKKADFTFTGSAEVKGTGANTYLMGLKEGDFRNDSKNFTNVKFIVTDGKLVINKRPVKVTAKELEYAYDYANPAAHPADNVVRYTVEAANGDRGLLTGDALNADVLYDGQSTQTLIGVYQAVAQIAAAKITNADGDVTANYTIEKVDSTLTIKGNDPLDPGKETTSVQTNYTVGDVIEYKITVKNVSRDEATNVVVTDSMAEIQDSAGYTVSEDRHTATIASIPAGGTVLVYARHTVTAEDVENAYAGDASGSLTNVANIKFGDWNKDVEGDHDELNDTYEYVVRYYWNNYTSVQPHEEKKLTARVGTEVTEKPAAIEGYTPVSADSRKLTISADQSKNVIEFYYYKNVELTANSETYTYDGAEKQVNGFTIKGENKDQDNQTIAADFSAITVGAKGIDAGEYPADFAENTVGTVDKTGRYIVAAANNGKLVINPVTGQLITITANSASKIYDGTPLTDNGFDYTKGVLADGDVLTAVVEGSATNVGDEGKNVVKNYAVKRGKTDVTKNYTFGNSIDGKLTINPRKVTLTSETASKEYDGTPLTRPDVDVTGDGFVAGEVTGITATGSVTLVDDGEVTNAITYTPGANFKEKNYTISKDEGTLSITKRGGEGKTITVTANSGEKVYDGAPLTNNGHTHAGALVEGDTLTAVVEGSQTDVGSSDNVVTSYKVMRGETDVTNNYTFGEPIIGTLTVTPVAIELTAASASKQYDGTPLTKNDYEISNGAFVGEEGLASVTVVGSQTLVGESANKITAHSLKGNTLAQNYTITYQPGKLTVTKNEKAITVTANSHTWEYDGQPHSDGGYTVEYDGQTYKVEAGKTVTLQTGDIVKAKITKTVTNVSDSAPNNNTIDELTIVNAAGEDTKGQYKTIPLIPGTLTITKRGAGEEKVKITAADNTVEYDGQPHGAKLNAANQIEVGTSFTVTNLAEGHSVKTLAIDGSETDAGVYANKLVPGNAVIVDGNGVEVTANYDITYVPGTLTITKRGAGEEKVKITAADNTVEYDGQPHGAKLNAAGEIEAGVSYTITNLANGHKVQSVVISGRETAVGEYENKLVPSDAKIVDAAGNDVTRNYVVGYENGKLTITSPDTVIVTIRGNTATFEYDGKKQEVNGYEVVSISNTLYTEADFDFADGAAAHAEGTDAGDYFMNLTKDSFVNKNGNFTSVTFVVEDGKLTITRRGLDEENLVKIIAADNTVYYDGQPHGAKLNAAGQIEVNVSYTTEYLAPGHKVQSVVIDGSRTKVGLYKDELVPKSAVIVDKTDKDVTENYEITYVRGTLEIRKNETEIKVTANSHTWEYDGQAHSDGGYTVTYGNESYTVKAGESATLSTGDKVTAVVKGQVKDVDDTKAGNNEIVEWSVEHRDFYNNVTPANGTLTITPRKVTLTSASDSKPYDGTPLTNPEVAVTGDGFVAGEVSDIKATGSVTYVSQGEVDNLITFTKKEGFKDSNYEIEERIGKLSIEALDVTIIITGPSAIREYKPGVTHTIVTGGSELDFVYGSDKVDGKIGVKGMVKGDKILPGTLKHTLEGMYVGEYEGVFTLFDSNGKKADKPTVMHDGVDVTENYKFSYNPGKLTITGKHMDGGKEVENEVPEKNYLLGQKIPFTITVRSVSKDELKEVTVTDPTATILPDRNTANPAYTVSEDEHTATITSLAPEAEVIVYAEHEVTEDDIINRYTNEATINWGNDEVKVSKTPSIEEENPEAELVKEIVLQDGQDENHKFKLGETVYFKITVTNTGNVTLNEYEVKEVLPGAAFIDGTGYTLNNDKTVATIEKMEPIKDGQEAPDSNQIVLYAQYNIKEEDLGNKELKNIVTADNSKPGEVPIPVDEAKSVSGQKIWKDEGNAFNTRPASITLTLMRKLGQNGAAEQYRTMQLGSNDSWRYSFDHLPKHDAQENEYFYWVVEEPVTGYDTAYETKDESHCDIVNNLQTYTLTIHYWQHKLGDTKMEQAFPDYVATLYYKQPYDVESPEREGIILDDMSQARISGTMPVHDLVIDVYYHRIAYRLTIHYIYQDGTMAHEDYTWTYWFNSTYNVPSPIIPGFTPSIDVIAGRMPSHGLELTVVYVGDGEIVIPDEDTSLGFKSYLNAGECFE